MVNASEFESPAMGDIRELSMSPLGQEQWFGDRPATKLDEGLAALLPHVSA